jgi:hypothetical protein
VQRPPFTQQQGQLRGVPQYMMKRRGVFKTTVVRPEDARVTDAELTADEIAEIEFNYEGIRPYLRA